MRFVIAVGLVCAVCATAQAQIELYALARDSNNVSYLVKMDPADATSSQVVGPLSVSDPSWLGYDPVTDSFLAHNRVQMYRIDRYTGAATALANASGVPQMQGVDYVDGVGVVTAFGPATSEDKLGRLHNDGTVTQLYDYDGLSDFDEIVWDRTRDQLYISATQQAKLYTIDIDTGNLLNTLTIPAGNENVGRGSIHPGSGVLYDVSYISSTLQTTIYLRDPVTGLRTGSIGTVPGFSEVHGLAFTPEPNSALALAILTLLGCHGRNR